MNSIEEEKTPSVAEDGAATGAMTGEPVAAVEESSADGAAVPSAAAGEAEVEGGVDVAAQQYPEPNEGTEAGEAKPSGGDEEPDIIPPASEQAMQTLSHLLNSGGAAGLAETVPSAQPASALEKQAETLEQQAETLEQLTGLVRSTEKKADDLMALLAEMTRSQQAMAEEAAKSVTELSLIVQKVADDTEQTAGQLRTARVTSALSPWFLVLSLLALVLLLAGMGYLAMQQKRLQERQDKVSFIATEAAEIQEKKLAAFDKRFAELLGAEIKGVREAVGRESVKSKLNRLRNGATEQRIIRKSSGDWVLPGKKEELVTDQETIEALNQAFEKSGRQLVTPPSIPPHSVLSILKPDGKGGTELVVTRDAVPPQQPEKAAEPDRKAKKRS
ncbi:hypothetical protein [Trichlorobacter ammonificans]|uniref:Uncharacterized protein n=1 Tax=Trichlorobacter ammonificans TaxID=2916410 RepID=A0ABN8HH55_9BACT|nr:hypothetical protein [Trichlorobacter ammonificans]CAH2032137.1 conserved protein of unknown function [Trichlorobacter ammonificans]